MNRKILLWATILVLLTAGCMAPTNTEANATTTVTSTETNTVTTASTTSVPTGQPIPEGPHEYPNPPNERSNETVEETVVKYEKTYIRNHLATANISELSFGGAVVSNEAEIVKNESAGAIVKVTQSYSYSDESGFVDLYTESTYFVNTTTIRRMSGSDVKSPQR